jgi:hypothetical protein
VFAWSAYANPHMKEQWEETIRDLKDSNPDVESEPWFQQHYLGKWVTEDSSKIYRYRSERNDWDGRLPAYGWKNWNYVLGIDLGFDDATALCLLAYHEHDPHTYIIRSDKWKGLTISDTAEKINLWSSEYPINYYVVDGANKQAVQEMVRHHGIPLEAADKHDKVSFIRIMNSAFQTGKIKIDPLNNKELINEYDKVLWDKKWLDKGIYKEHPGFHGDLVDAALYAYRFTYSYTAVKPEPGLLAKSDYEKEINELNKRFNGEKMEREQREEFWLDGSEHLFD